SIDTVAANPKPRRLQISTDLGKTEIKARRVRIEKHPPPKDPPPTTQNQQPRDSMMQNKTGDAKTRTNAEPTERGKTTPKG
ncbi:hypothetical protein A2U01_0069279, partial [Trifolium medium]|nr:hypothetical protein [Trifolium medium]